MIERLFETVARRRAACVLAAALLAAPASPAATPEQEGDRAWSSRGEGFAASGLVRADLAAAAVAAYERAVLEDPASVPKRCKLVEALYFQGHFATPAPELSKKLFERAVKVAEEAVDLAASAAGDPEVLRGLPVEERAERLRDVAYAAPAHFWAAIAWGLWGTSRSRAVAAAKNAAGRIRDHARIVTLIDPEYADAGGMRLLGRLHTATPRVPLFTGWIDRREGLELLGRANAISTRDPRNPLFLAQAILDHDPRRSVEALELLRELARRAPDPAHVVEQTEILEQARALLRRHDPFPAGEVP